MLSADGDLLRRGDHGEQQADPALALLQPDGVGHVAHHGPVEHGEAAGQQAEQEHQRRRPARTSPFGVRVKQHQAERIAGAGRHLGAVLADAHRQPADGDRADHAGGDVDQQQAACLAGAEAPRVVEVEQVDRRHPAGAQRQAEVGGEDAQHVGPGDDRPDSRASRAGPRAVLVGDRLRRAQVAPGRRPAAPRRR